MFLLILIKKLLEVKHISIQYRHIQKMEVKLFGEIMIQRVFLDMRQDNQAN